MHMQTGQATQIADLKGLMHMNTWASLIEHALKGRLQQELVAKMSIFNREAPEIRAVQCQLLDAGPDHVQSY